MPRYMVQLQHGITGAIDSVEFVTRWDPTKVNTEEVARACAAQHKVAGGKVKGDWKHPYAGLTAVLQED